jgi:hypothetical protein
MMKNYKNTIVVVCLFVLLTINLIYIYNDAITNYYGIEKLNLPVIYFNLLYFGFRIFPIILLYYLIKNIFKTPKKYTILFSLLTYMVFYVFVLFAEKNRKLESYKEYGQMIIPAVVFDKAASSRGGQAGLYVYYYYKGEKEITRVGMNSKKPSFNSIHKGDTVLIMYAVEYRHWNHLYRLHPTPEELNRCRNGCFYFNKQIQDTIPNLPDDPFKLKW